MEDYPKNLLELERRFSTEEACRQYLYVGDNLLPLCNRVAALVKRWLVGTHQGAVSREHLDYYLDEYTFRFNRRTSRSRGKLFYRLLQQAIATEPTTYDGLVQGVWAARPGNRNM